MTQFRPSRFEILPTVIKNLLIINALVFLAQNTIKGPAINFSLDDMFALHAWQSSLFKPWQLVTHLFMHGDIGHIFGNMFALWMLGSVLENLWGSKRFLTFYLICGLGAALIHLLFLSYEFIPLMKEYSYISQEYSAGRVEPAFFQHITANYQNRINMATIGASGAVFGVLAAFVYLFPNTYMYLYFLVPVKVKWIGLVYFGYEIYFAVINSAGDNVARWAHIGGGVVGLLIVITWNKTNKKTFY